MPRFAANLGYLFTDRPLIARIDAAAACGFKAIELQFPYDVPASDVKAAITRNGLTILGINTLPGGEGEFGFAAVPGREADWRETFARALDYITAIGGSAIHCLAGKVVPERRAQAEAVFIDNLARAADLAAEKNIRLLIEPINPRDRPASSSKLAVGRASAIRGRTKLASRRCGRSRHCRRTGRCPYFR